MGKEIKDYLDDYSEPIPRWVTWSIYMVGNTPDAAVPTIIFCCAEEPHRKVIRNTIKKSNILADHPGVSLKHLPRAPDYDQLVQLASRDRATAQDEQRLRDSSILSSVVFCSAGRIAPGTPLLIHPKDSSNVTCKATAGGLLRVGEKHYLMTAAHAFSDQPELPPSSPTFKPLCFTDSDDDDGDDVETPSRRSSTSLQLQLDAAEDSPSLLLDIATSLAPNEGIHSTDSLNAPTHTSCEQVEVEPATNSYSNSSSTSEPLGAPTISSIQGPHSGLDYALVEMTDLSRLDKGHAWIPPSHVAAVRHFARKIPTNSTRSGVVSFTASGGFLTGLLSKTPTFIRPPHAKSYQEVYPASFSGPLFKGDCGSWVIDPQTGALQGHIVAGSLGTNAAYIVPAHHVFVDIERQLQKTPTICLGDGQCNLSQGMSRAFAAQRANLMDHLPGGSLTTITLAHTLTRQFQYVLGHRRRRSLIAARTRNRLSDTLESSSKPLPSYFLNSHGQRLARSSLGSFPLLPTAPDNSRSYRFRNTLLSLSKLPLRWENPGLLDEALSVVPLEFIYEEAEEESQVLQAEAESLGPRKKPAWATKIARCEHFFGGLKDSFSLG